MQFFFADHNWIDRFVQSQSAALKKLGITDIVGISRGGIFPALLCAYELDLPNIHLLRFDRETQTPHWQGYAELTAQSRVLLCEDFSGSGQTLSACLDYIQQFTQHCHVFTISHFNGSRIKPDFGHYFGDVIAIYPWERHSVNPEERNNYRLHRKHIKKDSEYFKYGSDLDGIFLPDIHEQLYHSDLPEALRQRAALAPYDSSLFPPLEFPSMTIITGRPNCDYDVTQQWLNTHGIAFTKLLMRDPAAIDFLPEDDHYTKAEKSAKAKAEHILVEGITHFYESDPLQAMSLANMLPMVRVFWWNNALIMRKLINIDTVTE